MIMIGHRGLGAVERFSSERGGKSCCQCALRRYVHRPSVLPGDDQCRTGAGKGDLSKAFGLLGLGTMHSAF